jgi:uncharacterized protein (TIGR02757 family)
MSLTAKELKSFLDEKYDEFNRPNFIESDPISIPHRYSKKEDIEIIGFLAATIAWGQRKTIINNASKLAMLMDDAPYDFIQHFEESDLDRFADFKHRTFNAEDVSCFMRSLQQLYKNHGGLEGAFAAELKPTDPDVFSAICGFRKLFFELPHPSRTEKHVSNPAKGSSSKRLNMFLRWMVRNDNRGVDFGIWTKISPSQLVMPLDVHTGNVGRKLGLLTRKQNDWRAASELNESLRKLDPNDPVKYDFALFGLGVFEGF